MGAISEMVFIGQNRYLEAQWAYIDWVVKLLGDTDSKKEYARWNLVVTKTQWIEETMPTKYLLSKITICKLGKRKILPMEYAEF